MNDPNKLRELFNPDEAKRIRENLERVMSAIPKRSETNVRD